MDKAPEAPWRCPEECAFYQKRMADVNWRHGSLVTPPTPEEPDSIGEDDSIAELLENAENIVNAVANEVKAELPTKAEQAAKKRRRWWPFKK